MKILVIEDVAITQRRYEELLKDWGYTVITTDNPTTALNIMKQNYPDVVLLDINLPVMSGLELLEKIFKIYNPYVIMCTGKSEQQTILKALELGAKDYVVKPINEERLKVALYKAKLYKKL